MTTQATTHGRQGLAAHLAMTALTLSLIGAFVVWQARQGDEAPAAPAPGVTTQSSVSDGVKPIGGLAELVRETQRPRSGLAIHITASEEAATALRAALDQAAMRLGGFSPPQATQVLVAGSMEAESIKSLPLPPGTRIYDAREGTAPDAWRQASASSIRGGLAKLFAEQAGVARNGPELSCIEHGAVTADILRDTCP